MATRYYFATTNAPVSPAFDSNWEQTGQAVRSYLTRKTLASMKLGTTAISVTVPITTTQDILCRQFVSEPLPAQVITGTFSLIVCDCIENASTNNAFLAVNVYLVSQDGGTVRGILFSNFNQDTEFSSASSPTRIVNAQTLTQQTAQQGDRIVVEVGVHVAGPTASGSAGFDIRNDQTSDYALTSGLTTTLNTWCEFSQDLFLPLPNNFQFAKVPDGMSVSEKIR